MTPLLTIGIPTYNRAPLLIEMLQSVVKQVDESLTPLIEILISDNGSTDKTAEVVAEFAVQNPDLQVCYNRHENNLGIDANIYAVAKLASGVFVFIVSDDDFLLPGALARVVAHIKSNPNLDAICPNFRPVSPSERETALPWFNLDRDFVTHSKDAGLSTLGTLLTYLSCLIFRRDVIIGKDYNERVGTFLLCSYLFVDVIKTSRQSLIFKEPCLAARPNQSVNYDLIDVFVSEFARVLEYARRNGFSNRSIRTVLSAHSRWLVGTIYHYKQTSYRPSLLGRSKDTLKVLSVWRRDFRSLLRVAAAIWLPLGVSHRLVALYRRNNR